MADSVGSPERSGAKTALPRRCVDFVRSALLDGSRLVVALFSLNARKTWDRHRGRPGACQHPSDSGRAGETACDAHVGWHHPGLLRVACPRLRHYPGLGWRCSVNQRDVRPHWGRAALVVGALSGVFYLATTAGLYAAARSYGYPVRYPDIAWPPAWRHLNTVRAEYFLARAHAALAARDPVTARLNLATATHLDPRHFSAGLLEAQLTQTFRPQEADRLFRALLAAHPDRAELVARTWLPGLLARGEWPMVRALARQRLLATPSPEPGAWLRAWWWASQQTRTTADVEQLASTPRVPRAVQPTLELLAALERAPDAATRVHLLTTSARETSDALHFAWACRELAEAGQPALSLSLLAGAPADLPVRDAVALRLSALAQAGRLDDVRSQAAALLGPSFTPAAAELLCAHLLRFSDERLQSELIVVVRDRPAEFFAHDCPTLVALFCVSARARRHDDVALLTARIEAVTQVPFRAAQVLVPFLDGTHSAPPSTWLPLVQPVSLEILYALLESSRLADVREPTGGQH